MTKPTLTSFSQIAPLLIQQYERYLPTAFDNSMSMLQKVNKIIEHLEQMGILTNGLVEKWNEVMEWVMNEGLGEAVNAKLDEMANDGTLEQIINIEMIGLLTELQTENKGSLVEAINENNTKIKDNEKKIPFVTPLNFGAIGDGVADDTTAVRQAIAYAEANNLKLLLPKVFMVSGELEVKKPITIEGIGAASNEGELHNVKQISGFLFRGEGVKRLRTRINFRSSSSDPDDSPLSVALNIQSENVTLRNFSIMLWFDKNDMSPMNYGSNWDIGIFNGCRTYLFMEGVHVLGYWREASIWVDVTHGYFMNRHLDLAGVPYPNTQDISGADSMTMIKCYVRGGKWGLRVAGAKPKTGQAFGTNGWYGDPINLYYDGAKGEHVTDRRGSYGFSDFNVYGSTFFGTDHHSKYRRNAMSGNYETDIHSGGCLLIDGMAGNNSGRVQGHRFVSCRFASFEPYRVKLDRANRSQFYGCHFETGGSTVYNPDGSVVTRTAGVDVHGVSVSATQNADNLIVIGSSGYLSREFIHANVRFTDMYGASSIARSETTDEMVVKKIFSKNGIYSTETDTLSLKRMIDTVNRTEEYVMRAYTTGNIEFMGAGIITSSGKIEPAIDNTHDLGSNTKRWRKLISSDGIQVTTPDGTKKYLIRVDDSGNVISQLQA